MIRVMLINFASMAVELFVTLVDLIVSLPISKRVCLRSNLARRMYVSHVRRSIQRQGA